MTTLQKIVKAAKALKKKYPNKYSKWTDYVKAASKTVKPVKKVGAVKKKAAPKKKAPARSSHKDTKSHNVNIRVISGMDPAQTLRELQTWQFMIKELQKELKTAPVHLRAIIRQDIAAAKKFERNKKALLKKQLK